MKLTKVLLVFSILRGVACLPVTEFKGECRLNVVEYLCTEDDCEGTQLHCEDNEGHVFPFIGLNKDEIDNMVNDGTLESSISVFDPNQEENISFDGEYLRMNDSRNFTLDDLKLTKSGNFIRSPTTGDNKMLLVIIDALDYTATDYHANRLSSDVFGHANDKVNVNSIFRGCSSDALRIYAGEEQNMDAIGTIRINIDMNLTGSTDSDILNAAKDAAEKRIGKSLPGDYQNVYFTKKGCYPKDCTYAAYAYVGSWRIMFRGQYISDADIQAHEHGHNFGFMHSGKGTDSYADRTCLMGDPLYGDDTGPMCFNPAKSWMLGWYPGGLATYDPSTFPDRGSVMYNKFIGVGEWSSTSPETVVVKIEMGEKDLFVGFNRKAGANSGNVEFSDEVTVIEAKTTTNRSGQSWIKAHLKTSETYTQSSVTIKVCKIVTDVVPGYANVLIYTGEANDGHCNRFTDSPTKSPTDTPTIYDPCVNVKKKKCTNDDKCEFGKKKIKVCSPKKKHKFNCKPFPKSKDCRLVNPCKWSNGKCLHKCELLKKKKTCNANIHCKYTKVIPNPCSKCQLATCASM